MDFKITERQQEYKRAIIEFAQKELNNFETEGFSKELWKKCADFGLFGLPVENGMGGLGEDYLTTAIIIESLGYACEDNGFIFAINNHLWVCENLIYKCGNSMQKEKYLGSMISGNLIGAFALTESNSGSDAYSMKTKAVKVDGGFIINGNKMFISNAPIADIFVVLAVTGKPNSINGVTSFIVEKSNPGVKIGKYIEKMGLNSCPMAEVTFEDCFITDKNILGNIGSGMSIISFALEWERCFEFASHIGVMKRQMEKSIKYSKNRIQFGRKISDFQGISHKIADMKMNIELAELLLYKIAWMKDNNYHAYLESSIFKLFVSESYIKTCLDTIKIYGAYGYTKESGIGSEFSDSIASSIYSGTSEVQRNTIFKLISSEYN